MRSRILIIEDDTRLAEMLALHLGKLGNHVTVAHDGERGLVEALGNPFDLIILDRGLPGMDGIEVCRELRHHDTEVRILMLTALAEEFDFVAGLDTGADDYVGKPFRLAELTARVNALLRRGPLAEASSRKVHGRLCIDIDARRVHLDGRPITLTAREFDLLVYLAGNSGRVCSREQILNKVWQSQVSGYEDSVNTIVKRLRKKIDDGSESGTHIETVRGVGYRFVVP